jgi:hypothetical protein
MGKATLQLFCPSRSERSPDFTDARFNLPGRRLQQVIAVEMVSPATIMDLMPTMAPNSLTRMAAASSVNGCFINQVRQAGQVLRSPRQVQQSRSEQPFYIRRK